MKERDDTAPYIVLWCPFLVGYVGKRVMGGFVWEWECW